MFGESDSESPRVPSPWDPYISSASPVPPEKLSYSAEIGALPQLVAEHEEVRFVSKSFHSNKAYSLGCQGNVEYKLHLLNPSQARLARLTTQLKWRLLEGGGQAFYELGVSDSGALIGLTQDALQGTLETLQAMAADLGARVVIVKEIELMGVGVRVEDEKEFSKKKRDRDRDKEKGRVKAKFRESPQPTTPALGPSSVASTASTITSITASSFSSTLSFRADSDTDSVGLTADCSPSSSPSPFSAAVCTPEDGPFVPAIEVDLDDSLALFSMDPEPDMDLPDTAVPHSVFEDIAGVAKGPVLVQPSTPPAPLYQRPEFGASAPLLGSRSPPLAIPHRTISKAEKKRINRDVQRAERQDVLGTAASTAPAGLVPFAEQLPAVEVVMPGEGTSTDEAILCEVLQSLEIGDPPEKATCTTRTIVEAMIIRQLNVEEAFLNFTAFDDLGSGLPN
ncbi:hypothetical protein EWM64_g5471 [Hericium alpestre]|uniref:Uncharacterized protein n=1 Tax=Hericium alpestre TaxID=135208 RepID=A0A4Y9ZWL5_9AGAM|nr:hypothetical protein EWM64_g5471 [Hericium alpestre]